MADVLPVVRRNTYCFFLYSSPVKNFSCSAWNMRTTSPCRCQQIYDVKKIYIILRQSLDPSRIWNKTLHCTELGVAYPFNQTLWKLIRRTPLSISSLFSLWSMKRLIFQHVLQLTEFTWNWTVLGRWAGLLVFQIQMVSNISLNVNFCDTLIFSFMMCLTDES